MEDYFEIKRSRDLWRSAAIVFGVVAALAVSWGSFLFYRGMVLAEDNLALKKELEAQQGLQPVSEIQGGLR